MTTQKAFARHNLFVTEGYLVNELVNLYANATIDNRFSRVSMLLLDQLLLKPLTNSQVFKPHIWREGFKDKKWKENVSKLTIFKKGIGEETNDAKPDIKWNSRSPNSTIKLLSNEVRGKLSVQE